LHSISEALLEKIVQVLNYITTKERNRLHNQTVKRSSPNFGHTGHLGVEFLLSMKGEALIDECPGDADLSFHIG